MARLVVLSIVAVGALLVACSHAPAPVEESVVVTKPVKPGAPVTKDRAVPEYHVVERGETLYSIAFRYGLDFRVLAAANGIGDTYTIYPGQKLRLRARSSAAAAPAASTGKPVSGVTPGASAPPATPTVAPTESRKPVAAAVSEAPVAVRGNGGWQWPVQGKVLSTYNPNVVGPKGIALAGNPGDPVRASRDGRVVYIGSSLVGYGQLVILKHDDVYLSAYAHNSKVLVKEGDAVRAGDTIAQMGSSGTDRTKLHFEVRRNGDPIDPLSVLPRP